jgi:hypothetical protein
MKKRRKKASHLFKITALRQTSRIAFVDLEPEEFAVYVRHAEKDALPTIKEMRLGPGAAEVLLAQHAKVLATGDSRFTDEGITAVASQVLALWLDGYYTPGPDYPFTLEETLQELLKGVKAKEDFTDSFQAYTPLGKDVPRGIRKISGGIVKHPETNMWQIWIMDDGSWEFLAAYRDSAKAQGNLEVLINEVRRGGTMTSAIALYQQLQSQADGETQQLPYEMMLYLIEHHERFTIKL